MFTESKSLLDQLEPIVPDVLHPPIHFTHVLGPLFNKQTNEFPENKNCNLPFYDHKSNQHVTPLSYLLGYNAEHKIYHEEVEKLLQHPDLCLDTLCEKNLFKFLMRSPTPKNIVIIQKLCAYGIQITEEDVVDILKQFIEVNFSFADEKCDKKLAASAFEEMLKAPLIIDYTSPSENKTTPLTVSFRLKRSEGESINPFTQIIINVIKNIILKKIIVEDKFDHDKLLILIELMVGDVKDPHHDSAYKLLSKESEQLEKHFDSKYEQPLEQDLLGLMTNNELKEKETTEYNAFGVAVNANNFTLAFNLLEVVEYAYPEKLVNIILQKNNDNLHGIMHAFFNLNLSSFISPQFIAKMFAQYHKKLPKVVFPLLIALRAASSEFVEEFELQTGASFEMDRQLWEKNYKEFVIKTYNLIDISDSHWKFLLKWAVRNKINNARLKATVEVKFGSFLSCADLRDYAFYSFLMERYAEAIETFKIIENSNGDKLSLEDLTLLARANYRASLDDKISSAEKLQFNVNELIAYLKCELLCPLFIDEDFYKSLIKNVSTVIAIHTASEQDAPILNAIDIRAEYTKLLELGEKFLAKKLERSRFIFTTIMTLINGISQLKLDMNDRKCSAYSLYHATSFDSGNLISEKYKQVVTNYIQVIQNSARLVRQDWECLYQAVLYILNDAIKNNKCYKMTEFCDELIDVLLRKSFYMEENDEHVLIKKILSLTATHQLMLCEDVSTKLAEFKVTIEYKTTTSLKIIRALRSLEPVEWKKITTRCDATLKDLNRDYPLHRVWIAELQYHKGIYHRQNNEFDLARDCFMQSVNLGRKLQLPLTSDYHYALAECSYHKELPKNDLEQYFKNIWENLTPFDNDLEEQVVAKSLMIMKFLILKDMHRQLKNDEIAKLDNLQKLFDNLGDKYKDLLRNYIDLNLYLGEKTSDRKYFQEAVNRNPLQLVRKGMLTKNRLLNLNQDDKDNLIKLSQAYRKCSMLDFSVYSDSAMRNIMDCLAHIKHPKVNNEMNQCLKVFKHYTQKYQLIVAMTHKKLADEKMKREQEFVESKEEHKRPVQQFVENKEEHKQPVQLKLSELHVAGDSTQKGIDNLGPVDDPAKRKKKEKRRLKRAKEKQAKLQAAAEVVESKPQNESKQEIVTNKPVVSESKQRTTTVKSSVAQNNQTPLAITQHVIESKQIPLINKKEALLNEPEVDKKPEICDGNEKIKNPVDYVIGRLKRNLKEAYNLHQSSFFSSANQITYQRETAPKKSWFTR